jgi:hypothetical protein
MGHFPLFFYKVRRSSSRQCDPASAVDPALAASRSSDGQAAGAAERIPARHKTATLRRNPRWNRRYGGDRLNHPRYRDFATIPEAAFFQ